MEVFSLFNIIVGISTFLFALTLKFIVQKRKTRRNLPPSPPALPIIGHLHLLKQSAHRTLDQLSQKYGPVLLLQFGSREVLIVSSAPAAEECFTKNDIIFANRPQLLAGKHINYNRNTIGLAPYGDYWRTLRRLTATELFSTSRLAMSAIIRQEEVGFLLKELFLDSAKKSATVELTSKLIEVVFNMILRMIAGKRYYGKDAVDKEAEEFRDIMREVVEMNGGTILNDFLPVLQWVDFQGLERKMKKFSKKLDKFLQSLVEEHRLMRKDYLGSSGASNRGTKTTLIDVMLIAGTETSSTTIEWAMSLLLNHSEVMYKAWSEIADEVGQDKFLDETDLSKLNYLQSIVSETLRLFPATPLLVPHESSEDCVVCGYNVPRGTMLWRACPGAILGRKVVTLVLGSLIQSFEWNRLTEEEIDMREGTGLTMPKAEPLVAVCSPRSGMLNLLTTI
ncbi:MFP1 attachment factor 1 family protein [Hibiscus syriacus]|uniref:MFP1 attachment factor 1 family protein n=1 Tax=Hibiscus syriacus TaxID=106335 RepID=A0A6A2WIV1_HIBSY|nr:MFP1 attachment factor 1 family protein [Hibiscus syriacus]